MKRKAISIFIILIIITILSGCWNQRELNELAIAMALGFDIANEEEIELSIQVVLPEEVAEPSYYTPVTVYYEQAKSVFEAFRKMTTESPRKIYLPHFRITVISEEFARNGIKEILEMLNRDHEFRSDFYIVISKKGSLARDILSTMTTLERVPANKLYASLETSDAAWAPTTAVKLDELLIRLATDGQEAALTGVTIEEGVKKEGKSIENVERLDRVNTLKFQDIAVFKGDKLIGWLDIEESRGYSYIMDEVQSTVGRIQCPNSGELVLEVVNSETEVIPHLKDGKPEIEIKIITNTNIGEVICDVNLSDPNTIKELEKTLEERLKYLAEIAVDAAQNEFNSDIFGFGNKIYKKYPKVWNELKDKWDEEFPNLTVTYNVEGTINLTGKIEQSFFTDIEEK